MDPVLGGVVVERQQHVEVVGDLRGRLAELAAGLRDRSPALGKKVDDNATISVIGQVCELLVKEVKEARVSAVDELRSHATYLRDLRNYGLHPRGEVAGDLEHHFTEQSVAVTFMSSHRYFGRLAALAAQLPPSAPHQDPLA